MKHEITIYEKPTCSTCRQVVKAFEAKGIPFASINYILEPPPPAVLKKMVAGLDVPAKDLVRTKEKEFKETGLDIAAMTNAQIVTLLENQPALMQRPVLVIDGKYILGRPVEKVEKLIKTL